MIDPFHTSEKAVQVVGLIIGRFSQHWNTLFFLLSNGSKVHTDPLPLADTLAVHHAKCENRFFESTIHLVRVLNSFKPVSYFYNCCNGYVSHIYLLFFRTMQAFLQEAAQLSTIKLWKFSKMVHMG